MRRALLEPELLRALERLALRVQGRIRGQRRGERRSVRRGTGGEFADLRPYTSGDDLRHLDWHAFARLDELFVRLYEEPKEHTLHLLVDTSASMGCGKGYEVLRLAAALGYVALAQQDRVGVFELGEGLGRTFGPARSKNATHALLRFLDGVAFEGATDLERSARALGGARLEGTLVVVSDFLVPEGREEALKLLARHRQRVAVLHTLSPSERAPEVGREMTLVDAESGEELLVTVDRGVRDAYLEELGVLVGGLKETCRRLGFAFVEVDTGQSVEALVLERLRGKGVLRVRG